MQKKQKQNKSEFKIRNKLFLKSIFSFGFRAKCVHKSRFRFRPRIVISVHSYSLLLTADWRTAKILHCLVQLCRWPSGARAIIPVWMKGVLGLN